MIHAPGTRARQSGLSMIEVLVTLIILLVGLLGLAGLMAQSQRSEVGSYQRVQALVLLQDMVGRINANRAIAATSPYCYAFTTNTTQGIPYVGNPDTISPTTNMLSVNPAPNCTVGTAAQVLQFQQDLQAWNNELLGATEVFTDPVTNKTSNAGAMQNARGCVSYDPTSELLNYTAGAPIPGSGLYTVAVAWQGEGEGFNPPVSSTVPAMNCAFGLYGDEGKRRIVTMSFRIGAINNTL